jgi:hypothetical protein
MATDISEEHVASMVRVEEYAKQETSVKACFRCERITRRYIPEDRTLHNHGCENLNSYEWLVVRFFTVAWVIKEVVHGAIRSTHGKEDKMKKTVEQSKSVKHTYIPSYHERTLQRHRGYSEFLLRGRARRHVHGRFGVLCHNVGISAGCVPKYVITKPAERVPKYVLIT